MATKTGGKAGRFTFQWKIENVSKWWWLRPEDNIGSPTFEVQGNENTKWNLWLYPKEEEDFIGIFLQRQIDCGGPDVIQVEFYFEFLNKDGSISTQRASAKTDFTKGECLGFPQFVERNSIFDNDKEEFVLEDTMTVQCTMLITGERHLKSNHVSSSTIIKVKRRAFCCEIDKDAARYKFKDYSFGFDVILKDHSEKSAVNLTSFDDSIQYISCNISMILFDGTKQNLKFINYFANDLKGGVLSTPLSLPSTFTKHILSLQFEFVISIIEQFRYGKKYVELEIEKEKRVNTTVLTDDFKPSYYHGIVSDVDLGTSTKTSVHKGISSARSSVFRNMFNSNMIDQTSKDLEEKLRHTNACDILVLADRNNDDDLKNAVQDYILRERKQIFRSVEWKDIMSAHPKLAADLMYTKIIKSMM